MRRFVKKWRPPLALVLGGTLAAVLTLPILGIVNLRLWGNVMGWGEAAWLIAWIAIIATAVLGFLLWRLVLRPVWALDRYAQDVRNGGQPDAPTHLGTPEFMALAGSVMGMGESLQSRADSLQAYANHVTHELKSPLTAIRGAAELLDAGASGADAATLSKTIMDASSRMQDLLDDLVRHAQAASSGGVGSVCLSEVVDGLALPVEILQDGMVPLVREDLRTILTQLAGNAADHGATVLTVRVLEGGIEVADDGPGVSPGNRDRIFDPFFTTRREQGGTGMGLSIVRSLVTARGGQIALSDEGPGACFLVSFG
ncbi:HAMP domain-containing sensor histidine kinase [uncultured Tateyamaria sp.]|uniref:sensor histidine kinase n=1 Tax=uncultured Tateyamaria sp. TaxID=455651 RepID=UPI00263239FC|nr:HAMP domain-containing sensor histidine kinase [uncultured Tateyamaria sp.]